ncbi:MAG: NADPH-dependent glutamate synthase [Acidimicrobiia bacterium]|jgi:glutamate synthase (NADPH/NADH) small chain
MAEELTKRERMAMERTGMPTRAAGARGQDFDEVNLGYTSGLAVLEASRCLNCTRPKCVEGCPVGVQIESFIRAVASGDFATAADVIRQDNALPGVCGRVCPQEAQCEGACILDKKQKPIAIGHLERFVADWERRHAVSKVAKPTTSTGKRVAIVGSGPAGLACAGDLARQGHEVTVFEALHEPGGVLVYGIPEFRLPKEIVEAEVQGLRDLGVQIETDVLVGAGTTLETLMTEDGFDAVFVGTGAGLPRFPGIPGEDLIGVYSANEFLTRVNLMKAYKSDAETPVYDLGGRPVAVIGGGNTAMDAARTALRLGGDPVTLFYRRTEEEMPARREELEHAKEEGVRFSFLVSPVVFAGENGWLKSMQLQKMELGEPDQDGRRSPVPVEGAIGNVAADVAIIAIGNSPNPLLARSTPNLETTRRGTVVTDPDTGATTLPGVYAGGDIATGGATVILAMGAGRRAARAIDEYLRGDT